MPNSSILAEVWKKVNAVFPFHMWKPPTMDQSSVSWARPKMILLALSIWLLHVSNHTWKVTLFISVSMFDFQIIFSRQFSFNVDYFAVRELSHWQSNLRGDFENGVVTFFNYHFSYLEREYWCDSLEIRFSTKISHFWFSRSLTIAIVGIEGYYHGLVI